jgi:AhpD family alkylhydroperoxidase
MSTTDTTTTPLTSRMGHPVFLVPGAMDAAQALSKAISRIDLGFDLEYVLLRASQINGCGVCVDMHAKALRERGESEERVWSIAAWRESPYFTDAERAALELTEALTRIADTPEGVSDEVWATAREQFDDAQLSALILDIGVINLWNRTNVATRQIVGALPSA